MHLYGADRLPAANVVRLGQRALLVNRRRQQRRVVEGEHVEPVLPLQRHVDPGLGRVEIEVPRAEAIAAVRRDRGLVCQLAVAVVEHLQRPRFLGIAARRVMAARDQDDLAVVEPHPHLVGVDAGIDLVFGCSTSGPGVPSGLTR